MKRTLLVSTLTLLLVQCQLYNDLTVIDLRGKHLWRFPNEVLKNTKATELHIGAKGFTGYPPMSLLPDNKIGVSKIPEKIGQMVSLERLSVTASKIKSLPEALTALPQLHYLDISFNKNLNLENEINKIENMQNLDNLVVFGLMMTEPLKTELKNRHPGLVIIDEETLLRQKK